MSSPITSSPPSLYTTKRDIPAPLNSRHRANTAARRTTSAARGLESWSSSSQVWAQDYSDPKSAGKDSLEPLTLQQDPSPAYPSLPPAATLTSRSLSVDEDSHPARQARKHQRSLTALLPISRSTERKEKAKVDTKGSVMATLTGDKEGIVKTAEKGRGALSSWFSGSSVPVPLGVPVMDQELTSSASRATSPVMLSPDKTPPSPVTLSRTNTVGGGMFNFFAAKSSAKRQTVQIPADFNSDEFLTLDIKSALFPGGEPNANDPFSPASFRNLLMNAEGLLLKLQTAYKLRTLSFHELSAEKEAMSEGIEEAETRAQCLKNQLENLAHQVSSRDATIADLAAELAAEKQAHAEENLACKQSIALVTGRRGKHLSIDTTGEDLGISHSRRRNRTSDDGSSISTEGESDAESGSADSVFSRSGSPTLTMSSPSVKGAISTSTPEFLKAPCAGVVPTAGLGPNAVRPATTKQKSTLQKILGGISEKQAGRSERDRIGMGEEGCGNCRGKDVSVAWDAVGLMRAENTGLKDRVQELERAVDGALDACNGLF
ncbi:unnamed protein product [Diplocarpon coronariae]|uniref:Uncharacterized protein n=1 Tax=Diplocarpon coronariae TaxID=2795749 RepID=A0A218ZG17_9HELO|nr:hypothetical protein B2J93_9516 [Marssonina coronariae]